MTAPASFPELARLLAPFRLETFLSDYWEKAPLHVVRGPGADGRTLISLEEIDAIVTTGVHQHPDLTVVEANKTIRSEEYTYASGIIDPVRVARRFGAGSSIVLNRLDEWSPRVRELAARLEGELGLEIQANMYLSPAGAQGFPTHYDSHDVLIIQCVGSKGWRLYDHPRPLPMRGEVFNRETTHAGEISRTLVLNEGDVLYLPRGLMHDAVAEGDGYSVHVTIGLHVVRWSEVLIEALAAQAIADVELRRALPLGALVGRADEAPIREAFRQRVQNLVETFHWEGVRQRVVDRYVDARRDRVSGILVDAVAPLSIDTEFAVRDGVLVTTVRQGDELMFTVNGRETRWPARAEKVLAEVAARGRFKLADLDPSLDERGKLTLARRLIVEGLVRVQR